MFDRTLRLVAALTALPVRASTAVYRRLLTGRRAALELVVRGGLDLEEQSRLVEDLRALADDARVVALVLRFDGAPGGWARSGELRQALVDIARAGVRTVALLENPDNAALWLASGCDHVFMVPTGQVLASGVSSELTFFAEALERVGVSADVVAAGEYKAAGEPFTRRFASAANREATRALVDGLHQLLRRDLAVGRELEEEAVDRALASSPLSADEALEHGLIDGLAYPDQLGDWLEEELGRDLRRVSFGAWQRLHRLQQRCDALWSSQVVAVVHLQGNILLEDSAGAASIAARHVVPLVRGLRESSRVRAVVLHINSPGGSAYASDLIWREVEQLVQKKPVVACMSDVAASGGFYIAAPCTHLVAAPNTITGSIGVVGGKPVIGEALGRLGVHSESVAALPDAALFSLTEPFTPTQRERFRRSLQRTYDGFVQRVAAGRRRPLEQVEPHCRGRVWTGEDALAVGLVDRLGGLEHAIALARRLSSSGAELAHISGYDKPGYLVRQANKLMRDVLPFAAVRAALPLLGPAARSLLAHPGQALAVLPFDLRLR